MEHRVVCGRFPLEPSAPRPFEPSDADSSSARSPRRRRDKKIAGTRPRKHDTFVPRRVVIQKYREADARPGFRTLSWEMSSLNGARMVSPPRPVSPLLFSSALFPHAFSRCRRFIRGNYEATDSSCLEEFRARRGETAWSRPGMVVVGREGISGYGDFYVPILIHAATTRRMARYFLRATAFRASGTLKSMRAVIPRSPSLYPPLPLSSSFFPIAVGGWFISNGLVSSRGRDAECRRDFLTNVIVHSTMLLCSIRRDGALIVWGTPGWLTVSREISSVT